MNDQSDSPRVANNYKLRRLVQRVVDLREDDPNFIEKFRRFQSHAQQLLESGSIRAGNPLALKEGRDKARALRTVKTEEWYAIVKPAIARLRAEGMSSYEQLAKGLDALGIKPPRSDHWGKSQVRRVDQREI